MPSPLPRWVQTVPLSFASRSVSGFPYQQEGRHPYLPFRGLLSVHFALRPVCSLSRPRRPFLPKCFSLHCYLRKPPWLLPTGTTVVARDSHPLGKCTFARRTADIGITSENNIRIASQRYFCVSSLPAPAKTGHNSVRSPGQAGKSADINEPSHWQGFGCPAVIETVKYLRKIQISKTSNILFLK